MYISGNELVQFQPADNFLAHIGDLVDIIDDADPDDSVLPLSSIPLYPSNMPTSLGSHMAPEADPNLLDIPELTDIDPMSFINTGNEDTDTDTHNSGAYALD